MMRINSLKARISATIIIVMMIAVCLADILVVRMFAASSVSARIQETKSFLESIPPGYFLSQNSGILPLNGIVCIIEENDDNTRQIYGGLPEEAARILSSANPVSSYCGSNYFIGRTWAVFWKAPRFVLFCYVPPGFSSPSIAVLDLAPVYIRLRASQYPVALLLLLNIIVLGAFLSYRIIKMAVRPITRFVSMIDRYELPGDLPVAFGRRNDEFMRLSTSLKAMISRIETDRQRLAESLKSLEKANRELKETQERMVRAEKAASAGRLMAGIAHEIGNPLGIVTGYLGMLKMRPSLKKDPPALDFLNRAEQEVNRISSIIRRLLDFCRGDKDLARCVSIHEAICKVMEMVEAQPESQDICISCDLSAEHDVVLADSDLLSQVILNLVLNAIDAVKALDSPDAGKIQIVTETVNKDGQTVGERGSAWIRVKVTDNGIGIPPEYREAIFDPFYTTKDPGKGTGLGLYVCEMIIERFGGDIYVQSGQHRQTTFIIELPCFIEDGSETTFNPGWAE